MVDVFKNFYLFRTNQKLNESEIIINENINIIYYKEKEEIDIDTNNKSYENTKIFELPEPNNEALIKIIITEISSKLKNINYILSNRFQSILFKYILKVINNNRNNVIKTIYSL